MTQTVERMLPLYEGKMGHQYDHRAASFVGIRDTDIVPNPDHTPDHEVMPRYWVREAVANDRLARRTWGTQSCLLGFRRVARNTDERTCIATFIPFGAASYGWIISAGPELDSLSVLAAQYNSFTFDYVLRQFLSQPSVPQVTFGQLPTVTGSVFARFDVQFGGAVEWVARRVAFLCATSESLRPVARESGVELSPWNQSLRLETQAELDGAFFHFYGMTREEVDYVMETFPIVKRKDLAAHGEFRTKRLILEVYDAMQAAIDTGVPYRSRVEDIFGTNQARG